jgi:alcohol dehydrogenase class IV
MSSYHGRVPGTNHLTMDPQTSDVQVITEHSTDDDVEYQDLQISVQSAVDLVVGFGGGSPVAMNTVLARAYVTPYSIWTLPATYSKSSASSDEKKLVIQRLDNEAEAVPVTINYTRVTHWRGAH